ncbi:hypothetical protein D3C84_1214580 [compost metagenome]
MVFANPSPFLDECAAVAALGVVIGWRPFGDFLFLSLKIQPVSLLLVSPPNFFFLYSHFLKD